MLFEEAPRSPEVLARLHEMEQFAVTMVAGLLDNHPAVTVTDNTLSAPIVVAAVESLVHRLMTAHDPAQPEALEDENVLLLGCYLNGATTTSRTTSHDPRTQ
ncbi:hypothetical protein ACWEKT_40975 [Nocardia takedensis]